MENATKALLMAGGVLLALMILSLAIILYNTLNDTSKQYANQPSIAELQQRNTFFEKFRGRTDITIQEIITIYNYLEENKTKIPYSITLKIENQKWQNLTESDKIQKIQNENFYKYTCEEIKYEDDKVTEISFEKTNN